MEKLFAVIVVARQIDGEYVFVRTEKAFKQASQAEAYVNQLKTTYKNPDGSIKPMTVSSQFGPVNCMPEIGIFEIEVA